MAFSCVRTNVFSVLPLLVILSITPLSSSYSPNDKVTKALVQKLCSEPTIYKPLCISWLTSDAKTFTVDMQGLVTKIYQKTESVGYNNIDMFQIFERNTNDLKLKIAYGSCVKEYESATKAIAEAKGFASSNAYLLAFRAAFRAYDSISMCETYLGQLNIPFFAYPRILTFWRMCNIGRVFSELLI